jgi:hypothetical protein
MSKYDPLWEYVRRNGGERLTLSFSEIAGILSFPIDHAFLNCKKELPGYGYRVGKISLKEQTVVFIRESPA